MKRLTFPMILICLLVAITSCATSNSTPTPAPTPSLSQTELKVHFIDVGQGDSILIDLGETEVLIDGGNKSPGEVSYLNNFVDGALEVMVATHPHADLRLVPATLGLRHMVAAKGGYWSCARGDFAIEML